MSTVTLTPAQIEALRPLLEARDAPRFVLIGATALSTHVPLGRPTYDVDLVCVATPSEYEPWLGGHGWQRSRQMVQRWALGRVLVDVLPATDAIVRAGQVELAAGVVMSTVGFDLALRHAVQLPIATTDLRIEVASLPSLVVLKLAAWLDRPTEREKDLDDLMHMLRRALSEDADCRWDGTHPVGASGLEFDFQSAFYVGLEVGRVIGPVEKELVRRFLVCAQDDESPCFGRLARAYLAFELSYRACEDGARQTREAISAFSAGLGRT
jgi:predicted nucleotidyltransferase